MMRRPTYPSAVRGENTTSRGDSRPRTLSPQERRNIFVHMVRMELDQGPIRFLRRRQLIQFAEDLGIDRIEASLMIAQTVDNFGRRGTGGGAGHELDGLLRPQVWPLWMKLSLVLLLAALANLALIRVLSG